jgi:ankyrin repeat protein
MVPVPSSRRPDFDRANSRHLRIAVPTTSTQRASPPAATPQVDEGDVEGVQSLIDFHGSLVVTSKDDYGLTALHLASATGNDEMVSLFVRISPDR